MNTGLILAILMILAVVGIAINSEKK